MATKKNASTKKTTNGESASSRIRDWMEKHVDVTGNKEIAEAMGGDIKPSQVAAVKAQAKKKAGGGRSAGRSTARAADGRLAAEFIKEAGGLDNAISLLVTVKAIQEAA